MHNSSSSSSNSSSLTSRSSKDNIITVDDTSLPYTDEPAHNDIITVIDTSTDNTHCNQSHVSNSSSSPPSNFLSYTDKPAPNRGRPKRDKPAHSSIAEKQMEEFVMVMICESVIQMREKVKCSGREYLSSDDWDKIIKDECAIYELDPSKFLNEKTRRTLLQRIRRGKIDGKSQLPVLNGLEDYLVTVCHYKSLMGEGFDKKEFLEFVNSCIDQSHYQNKLIGMHMSWRVPDQSIGKVGKTWYYSFLKRHEEFLRPRCSRMFSTRRVLWSTFANFNKMYMLCYTTLVDARIAVKLDTPQYLEKSGSAILHPDPSYHLLNHYKLIAPEWLLFVDEMGSNTNMKHDAHNGRRIISSVQHTEKNHTKSESPKAKLLCGESDRPFTILPFFAATGEPVFCVIIIKGKSLDANIITGEDVTIDIGDLSSEEAFGRDEFTGPGKRFPGGPKCMFRNKSIDCKVCFSDSGGITSEILVIALEILDKSGIYDRQREGKIPVLMLDSHPSRYTDVFFD